MKIAVIGMGKIGLPLAVQYAKKGNSVIGVDVNPKTVDLINQGLEPFPGEAYLNDYLTDVVSKQMLRATLDYPEAIKSADVIVVVVPLLVNEKSDPDFVEMDKATALIGANIKKGALICYETTLPIGTTRARFVPSLEKKSGFKVGIEFNVVFSPERVFTGRIFEDLKKYPKIVGGITQACTEKGVHFYEKVLDFDLRYDLAKPNGVWQLKSAESAEFVKLAETTYRDVNIALANEFAMHSEKIGINIYEVIEAANSQNFSHIHKPGISVGGHCIPVYPHFYLFNDPSARVIRSAREVNNSMPEYAINYLQELMGNLKDKNILILGLSYRAGVKEIAFSGALEMDKILKRYQSNVQIYDPMFTREEIIEIGLCPYDDAKSIDAIIVNTDHLEFIEIIRRQFGNVNLVFDGRYILKNLQKLDQKRIHILGIGN